MSARAVFATAAYVTVTSIVALVLADQVSRADRDTDPGQPTILGPLARRVSSFKSEALCA